MSVSVSDIDIRYRHPLTASVGCRYRISISEPIPIPTSMATVVITHKYMPSQIMFLEPRIQFGAVVTFHFLIAFRGKRKGIESPNMWRKRDSAFPWLQTSPVVEERLVNEEDDIGRCFREKGTMNEKFPAQNHKPRYFLPLEMDRRDDKDHNAWITVIGDGSRRKKWIQ